MNEQIGSGDAGTLLLVDDDPPFLNRLARAMERRGFDVRTAGSVADGKAAVDIDPPDYAVVDLRLGDGSGVDVVSHLQTVRPESRAIILTGYGNIATAVAAVKVGAIDYLPKPADADAIETALKHMGADPPGPP
ncbi:MAG: response regulator, partial [Alphaproteobacteria bacterium]|nr:response regulator [Alphaproteobacteria bacterium]